MTNDILINHIISVPPPPDPGCKTDADCSSKLACFSGDCKNPCLVTRPCAPNADCSVYDTLPRRTMTCTCREGFKGKGDVRCEKIGKNSSLVVKDDTMLIIDITLFQLHHWSWVVPQTTSVLTTRPVLTGSVSIPAMLTTLVHQGQLAEDKGTEQLASVHQE